MFNSYYSSTLTWFNADCFGSIITFNFIIMYIKKQLLPTKIKHFLLNKIS